MERTRLVLSPSKVAMGRSDDLSGLFLQTCTENGFVDVDACELKCEAKVCRFLREVTKMTRVKTRWRAEQSVKNLFSGKS